MGHSATLHSRVGLCSLQQCLWGRHGVALAQSHNKQPFPGVPVEVVTKTQGVKCCQVLRSDRGTVDTKRTTGMVALPGDKWNPGLLWVWKGDRVSVTPPSWVCGHVKPMACHKQKHKGRDTKTAWNVQEIANSI